MTEATAPPSICLLRLSALGDVTHVLPLLRTLHKAWPQAAIAWVIGKGEHRLLAGLPGVRFIEYDKQSGLGGIRTVRRQCGGHHLAHGQFAEQVVQFPNMHGRARNGTTTAGAR